MDEMNVTLTNGNMTVPAGLSELPPITEKTTLREVLDMLQLGGPPTSLPSVKSLWLEGGEPLVEMWNCRLYRSGLAIYYNMSGATVVWLPNCTKFTYHFNKLRDSEKDILKEKKTLPTGLLEELPWMTAVTLIGDHRVDANIMNRTGARKGTVDLSTKDNGDREDEMEKVVADPISRGFNWYDGRMGENPLDAVERRETRERILRSLTEKQRQVFIMYYRDAMKQEEIAHIMGTSQQNICKMIRDAMKKAKKIYLE